MFDQRYSRKCKSRIHVPNNSDQTSLETTESDNKDHDVENEEFYNVRDDPDTDKHQIGNNNENETEEIFYEKLESKMDNFNKVSLIASH